MHMTLSEANSLLYLTARSILERQGRGYRGRALRLGHLYFTDDETHRTELVPVLITLNILVTLSLETG